MVGRDLRKQMLKNDICRVVFTKKDGTERVMRATLLERFHPPKSERKTDRVIKENPDVIRVVDVDLGEWRSFRWDSIKEFRIDT
jgi:hypothetical protein